MNNQPTEMASDSGGRVSCRYVSPVASVQAPCHPHQATVDDVESPSPCRMRDAVSALRPAPRGVRFMTAVTVVLLTVVTAEAVAPRAPTSVAVYSTEAEELEVSWSSSDFAATIGYKVQWKSGTEDYAALRQASADPATSLVAAASSTTTRRYEHAISGLTHGTEYTVQVIATNSEGDSSVDGPQVEVSLGQGSTTVHEGGTSTVQVRLNTDPERTVVIPLEITLQDATTADYAGVPSSVTFSPGETVKEITATDDDIDDDDETVELGFGELPPGVSEGSPNTATVTIADNDDPAVTVSFDSATYAVTEGWTVDVVVTLNANPERTVTIPVEASPDASGDYSIPGSVTFDAGETQKSVNFVTVDDSTVESAETFTVSFGSTLPTGVSLGSQTTTSVTIADDDAPETGGLELSALAVTGGVGSMYPVFNPRVHHYAIRCPDATTLHVTATARDASHQLTLNNIPVAGMELDKNVVVDSDHDVAIELSDGDESVLYVVHCIPTDFPNVKITKKQAGVSDGLMFLTPARNVFPRDPAFMAIMDNNGVPRFVRHSPGVNPLNFRRHATDLEIDGRPVHYSVTHRLGSSFNGRHYLLDASFNVIGTVETALPEHSASLHDFLITKDNTFLFFSHGTVTRDVGGNETSTVENVIEEVSPTGDALWSWKSWDHLTIDPDCLGYTFGLRSDPDITAHINALTLIDGDVVASSRGCAQVVRINRSGKSETDDGTDIVWQLGGTDQDADDRAFLAISGDESGRNEFCRQHHATETASGTVVLFDNGVNCLSGEIGELTDPIRGDLPTFSRAVEYAIDPVTGTAEFHREVRLDRRYGYAPFTGSVDILENGHWLINWGYLRDADPSLSVEEYSIAISEVDASGTELLQVKTWEWEGTSRYSTFRAYRESEADVEIPLNLPAPTVTLALTPPSISENNGSSTVTASLDRASSVETTVTVTAEAMSPAVSGDFTLSSNGTLGITAGQTSSTGVVTVGAVDNNVDAPDKTVAVTATAENTNGVTQPSPVLLTITDDDSTPVITTTSPILVAENETEVATLQATDADRPAEDLAWAIAGGADRDKFMLTADGDLTFAEAKDFENSDDADGDGDYEVRVQVSDGANPVEAPLTVRLLDVDDTAPMLLSATVNGATLTLTYDEPLGVSSTPEVGDFMVSGGDQTRTVSRVSVSGSTVLLTLDTGAEHLEAGIQVSYTPGTNPILDVPGNQAEGLSRESVRNDTPDTTPPEVESLGITSNPGSDQTYAAEDEIEVTVTFNETVEVEGTPRLTIELGSGRRTANYQGGSGTAALVFGYEVAEGESDTDGVGVEEDSLSGGTIRDEARNSAKLDHEGLAADSGHKVDGVKPELAASGGAVVNGTTLTLTYDEPLDRSSTPDTGDFTVTGGDQARTVTGVSVSGSAVMLTLSAGAEHGEAGIQVSYTPGMKPLRDVPGNQAQSLSREPVTNETPDTTAPKVSSLDITSNPGSDETYAMEDEIEVMVTFSETVKVTGTPRLTLRVGNRNRTAGYESGTDTEALVFAYEVADGDEDTNGVSVRANQLRLNGGTIKDEAENAAELDHEALATQAGHKVDGVRPAFVSAAVDGSSLALTYGEGLDGGSRPASGDFTVEVGGGGRTVSGVDVDGSAVTLTINPAVEHGDTGIRVSYTVPTGVGTNPIQDEVGNDARGLSNQSVTNTTGAPNTEPEVTTPESFDVPENQLVARRLAARDTDPGDEVTGWSIVGGADQSEFSIASDTGELSFRDPPDFEAPGDNEYVVTVEVRSGAGARELEAEQTFTIRVTDEREPPEVPEAPVISGETADSLEVSWSEPDNTGPAITDYDVQYREKGTGRFIDGDQQGPGRTLTLEDLEPGTVYEVQVRAKNDEGTSDWSASGEGMTVTPLTVVMASGTDPPVSGPFTVRFSFSEPVTGFSASDIETGQDPACVDDQNNTVFCDPGIGTLQTADDRVFTTTVTPWTDRVAHSYTLRLAVPGGAVRSSVGSKPNEEPEEPLEVRVAPPGVTEPISSLGLTASGGNGSVRLSWNRPSDDGGSAIIRYEYRYAAAGEEFGAWENVAAPARSVTAGNLVNGREYVFEVRAVSALGKGGAETVMAVPELRIAPPRPPPAPRPPGNGDGGGLLFPPEAPAGLMALPGEGTVRLEWSPPESDGGTPILRHEYRLKEGLGEFGEWTPIADSAPEEVNATGYTVGELGNGTVYVFELRAVNLVGGGRVSEAVEAVMGLDPAYWSNFGAEDLQGIEASLERGPFGGGPQSLRLRFGAGLRFEESELDGKGEVTETRSGSYGYRYTSRTTGELRLDYDGGKTCELRLTFRGEGAGSYRYRCGGVLGGQGSFRMSGLNRGPEITSAGAYEVAENRAVVGQLEAVDQDKQDEITEYGIVGGADGGLFAVEAGELLFREAPDYEDPSDVESAEPASGAADNEYIVVVEVRSGEGERERKGSRAIRVRVADEEEPPEITGAGVFEVVENQTRVGQLEAVDQDKQDEITEYGIAGGADGGLFEVEAGELMFREAPDYETPGDVASDDPQSGAADNEYIVVVEVRSGEGERERRGSRAIRVRVTDEEEPPEITSVGPFEVAENQTRVGRLEAVDPDKQDEITGYGIAGGADGGLFAVEAETGELLFREAPDYENPSDVESAEPESGAADNEYIVVVEVRSGEGERERRGSRAIRVRVSDEEEPPEAPAAPAVTAEGSGSLKVSWTEPENRGPEIVDYEVRYREGGEEGYSDGGHQGTGLMVRLSGLKEGTAYEVQVRAVNQEGMSEWSEPGEGRTDREEADPEDPDPDDPSDFTEGDLEGRRLTLRLEGEEGAAGSLELRFGEGSRFEQIESGEQQASTRSEGASRSGSYTYERTGPGMGTVRLDYDDGSSCEIRLSFTGTGVGGFAYDCGEGAPAEGSFRLTTGSLFVPVILSAAGRSNSFFTSELTLTNRGDGEVKLDYTYTAHRGGGSGKTSDVLAPGIQKIETDALTYLRGLGIAIPETGNRIGTLRVETRLGSEVEAVVRTTTVVPEGRAGLAYLGVAEEEGFDEAVYLCGLRQNSRDRSNLAFQNMGAEEEGAITLRTTVYSGEAADATARVLKDVRLEPGGFHQYSGLLGVLGVPAQGYVRVERVEGTSPFYAYGVINDQANSDGSFIFPVAARSLEGTAGQTLPVIVETSEFRSELTVTNFSEEARTLDFRFVADAIKTTDKTAGFSMTLEAGQQEIVPEVVDELRRQGVAGLGSTRGFYAGAVFVVAEEGDMSGIVIGARTGSEGGGGQYSVFYNAAPSGSAFTEEAWVDGLQQNRENRSNLALVNTGEVDGSPSVFHLEIYDGETGLLAETVVTRPVPARRWHQINGILGSYAPQTRQGYIRIEKVSGENPFLAYGVVNDGGAPGERSGDGAYVPARE